VLFFGKLFKNPPVELSSDAELMPLMPDCYVTGELAVAAKKQYFLPEPTIGSASDGRVLAYRGNDG